MSNENRVNQIEFLAEMLDRSRLFFSEEELNKLASKTIALAGLGGIGAIVLEILARSGVLKFRIMDMDQYEMSNINRQLFATTHTVGLRKTEVAVKRIQEINPHVEFEMIVAEKANRRNAFRFIEGSDLFILEADVPSGVLLLHASAKKNQVPLIEGHCVNITGGTVEIYDYRDPKQICWDRTFRSSILNTLSHCVLGRRQNVHEMTDDELLELDKKKTTTASLGCVTNLIGCVVASEAIRLLIEKGKTYLYPNHIYLDLFNPVMKIKSTRSFQKVFRRLKNQLVG